MAFFVASRLVHRINFEDYDMNPTTAQTSDRNGMNTAEASLYLGVSQALLRKDRTQRNPQIPYSKVCNRVVYFKSRLDQFIAEKEFGQTA